MLTINLKSRFRNKTFWVSVIGALVLLSQQLGLNISKFIPSNYVDIINTIFVALTLIGITVDTSTPGISDQVVATTTTVQATNTIETVQAIASTTEINNTVSESSASSNIVVDNPDNTQSIGTIVNAVSAVTPN